MHFFSSLMWYFVTPHRFKYFTQIVLRTLRILTSTSFIVLTVIHFVFVVTYKEQSCHTSAPHHKHSLVVEINLHVFLTPVQDGDEVPLSRSDRCTLELYSPLAPTCTPYPVANRTHLANLSRSTCIRNNLAS